MQLLRLEISVANSAVSPQGKSERQAALSSFDRAFIRDRMPHGEIKGEVLMDLPDQPDEPRYRFCLPEFRS